MEKSYKTFASFYPFYLSQHRNRTCRRLHFIGSTIVLALIIAAIVKLAPIYLLFTPLAGYGFAWLGHFVFEKNKPATFTYPVYSLIGDWVMYKDMLTGRIKF